MRRDLKNFDPGKLSADEIKHFQSIIENDTDLCHMRDQLIDGIAFRRQEISKQMGGDGRGIHKLGVMSAAELLVKIAMFAARLETGDRAGAGRDTRPRPTEREIRIKT